MAACTTYSSRELFDWLRLSPRYAANRNVITWTTCKRATAEERAEQLGWWTYRIDRALQLRISCQQVLAQLGTAWCAHRLLSLSLFLLVFSASVIGNTRSARRYYAKNVTEFRRLLSVCRCLQLRSRTAEPDENSLVNGGCYSNSSLAPVYLYKYFHFSRNSFLHFSIASLHPRQPRNVHPKR